MCICLCRGLLYPVLSNLFQEEWDPALLHLDSNLLLDFVVLCMSAALGGVLAAGVGLPETLGYIMGGMVVGPSGANVIYKVGGGAARARGEWIALHCFGLCHFVTPAFLYCFFSLGGLGLLSVSG